MNENYNEWLKTIQMRQEMLAKKHMALFERMDVMSEKINEFQAKVDTLSTVVKHVEHITEENRRLGSMIVKRQSSNEVISPAIKQMARTVERLENLGETMDMSKIKTMVMETTREAIDEFFSKDIKATKSLQGEWIREQVRSRNNLKYAHEEMTRELHFYAKRYVEEIDKAKEYMSKTLAEDMSLQQAITAINAVINHTEQTRNYYELNQKQHALNVARYKVLSYVRDKLDDHRGEEVFDRKENSDRIYRLMDRYIADYLSRGGYKELAEELAEIDENMAALAEEDKQVLEEVKAMKKSERPQATDEEYVDYKRHERAISLLGKIFRL